MEVLKFSAVWCGPCKGYAPIFKKVSEMKEFEDVEFKSIDVEEDNDNAIKYAIRSVPTTVFVKDDKEVGRITGSVSESQLVKTILENK